jgi:hypothetical protein
MKRFFVLVIISALFLPVFFTLHSRHINERAGCCSHHGGVCGCSGSRAMCCDGTLSPSCRCY